MRPAKARRLARELLPLLTDGRPQGCKCPGDPGVYALPCDNKHIGSRRCPLTPKAELAELQARVTQLELGLSLLGESQQSPPQGVPLTWT